MSNYMQSIHELEDELHEEHAKLKKSNQTTICLYRCGKCKVLFIKEISAFGLTCGICNEPFCKRESVKPIGTTKTKHLKELFGCDISI